MDSKLPFISLPPEIPYEERLARFKKAMSDQIEYVDKNQTWTDFGPSGEGKIGRLSTNPEGLARKWGIKEEDGTKIYRELAHANALKRKPEPFQGAFEKVIKEGNTKTAADIEKNIAKAAPVETPAFERFKMLYDAEAQNQGKNIAQIVQNSERAGAVSKLAKGMKAAAGPVAGIASAATDLYPSFTKYAEENPGASVKEIATSPEGSKAIAGLAGSQIGAELGATAGAMAPGYLKLATVPVGAAVGAYGGSELAKLLTGVPAVDKIIREAHRKAKSAREEEASLADQAAKVGEKLTFKGPKDNTERGSRTREYKK